MSQRIEDLNIGITREEILSRIQLETPLAVWLGGSLVQGLGNSASDVDVFVAIKELDPTIRLTRLDPSCALYVTYLNVRRVDIEYWTVDTIGRTANAVASLDPDNLSANNLDRFSDAEISLLQSLHRGIPLLNESSFDEIGRMCEPRHLERYLANNSLMYFDDAFEDTVGFLEAGQFRSAAFRSRDTFGFAVDAFLSASGSALRSAKHRLIQLERLGAEDSEARLIRDLLWTVSSSMQNHPRLLTKFVQDTLDRSQGIVRLAERRMGHHANG